MLSTSLGSRDVKGSKERDPRLKGYECLGGERGDSCPVLGLFWGTLTLETLQLFTALGIFGWNHQDQSLVKLPGPCKDTTYCCAEGFLERPQSPDSATGHVIPKCQLREV